MVRGTVIQSDRNEIWVYVQGVRLDAYSALHPAFVSRHLQIQVGLEISKSDLAQVYLHWLQDHFDVTLVQPAKKALHNLYLYLLACQGVDEDDSVFRGVGLRT